MRHFLGQCRKPASVFNLTANDLGTAENLCPPTVEMLIATVCPIGFKASGQFTFSFTRWAGSPIEPVGASTNLVIWSGALVFIRSSITNFFDGTGRFKAIYNLSKPGTT